MNFSQVCMRQFVVVLGFADKLTKEEFLQSCHHTKSWQINISILKESLKSSFYFIQASWIVFMSISILLSSFCFLTWKLGVQESGLQGRKHTKTICGHGTGNNPEGQCSASDPSCSSCLQYGEGERIEQTSECWKRFSVSSNRKEFIQNCEIKGRCLALHRGCSSWHFFECSSKQRWVLLHRILLLCLITPLT